jgi:hypothetical protein
MAYPGGVPDVPEDNVPKKRARKNTTTVSTPVLSVNYTDFPLF